MRNTTINVSFNTEKLDALKFHMEKRDTDLQGELNDTVQKLYEKYVPQATREYIDDKVAREISARERTRRADRTARRRSPSWKNQKSYDNQKKGNGIPSHP